MKKKYIAAYKQAFSQDEWITSYLCTKMNEEHVWSVTSELCCQPKKDKPLFLASAYIGETANLDS